MSADVASQSSVIHSEHPPIRAYPANITFNDLIRANKRKSALLMVGMSVLLVLVGGAFAAAIVAYNGGDMQVIIPSIVLGALAAAVVAVGTPGARLGGGPGEKQHQAASQRDAA